MARFTRGTTVKADPDWTCPTCGRYFTDRNGVRLANLVTSHVSITHPAR